MTSLGKHWKNGTISKEHKRKLSKAKIGKPSSVRGKHWKISEKIKKKYSELRYEINNGITLCQAHHPRKRAKEKQLIPFFMGLINSNVLI